MARFVTECCKVPPTWIGTIVTGLFGRCPKCHAGDYWRPVKVVRAKRAAVAVVVLLALAVPTAAQHSAHPYIRPDLTSRDGTRHTVDTRPAISSTGATVVHVDGWLVAKIASSVAVGLASYADYQESQDAINERRAREGNSFVRGENGFVNGKRKAALTAAFLAGSWWLYARGRRRLAVVADCVMACVYAGLAVRAHQIGR